jgi:hypothetical protein
MKGYLLTTGTLFGLIGAMHLGTLIERWRLATPDTEFVVENLALGGIALSLAAWAFVLVRPARRSGV